MNGVNPISKRVSVTVIEPSGRLYGSEYCLLDILRGLRGNEFEWHVLAPGGSFADLLHELEISCTASLPQTLHKQSRVQRLVAYARLMLCVRQLRPGLIYVNQAGIMRAAAVICRLLRVPGVCQVQTLEDALWISQCRFGDGAVQAFICNSEFIAAHTLVPENRKCILYQGILGAPDPVQECGGKHVPWQLGIVGRISQSKGHYLTLEAAASLRNRGVPLRIRVIGDGLTPEDTREFVNAVRTAGLNDIFDFRGYCRDLRTELSQVQMLLIPSLAEPLGRVLYDAAHLGIPIIAADSGGLGEICRLYGVGESFPAGNAEALAARIEASLSRLPEVTAEFRCRSAKMVQSLNMSSYLNVVRSILLRAANRQPVAVRWQGDRLPQDSAATAGTR